MDEREAEVIEFHRCGFAWRCVALRDAELRGVVLRAATWHHVGAPVWIAAWRGATCQGRVKAEAHSAESHGVAFRGVALRLTARRRPSFERKPTPHKSPTPLWFRTEKNTAKVAI